MSFLDGTRACVNLCAKAAKEIRFELLNGILNQNLKKRLLVLRFYTNKVKLLVGLVLWFMRLPSIIHSSSETLINHL